MLGRKWASADPRIPSLHSPSCEQKTYSLLFLFCLLLFSWSVAINGMSPQTWQ